MKLQHKYAALAAAMMLACGTAGAQNTASTERTSEFAQSSGYEDYLKGKNLRPSALVGARVRNSAGDTLGEIDEIVIPSADRDDMLVILSVGGVLDVGDKLVALPYDDLRVSPDGDTLYFDRTEEQLKAAPAFTYDGQAEAQARVEHDTRAPAETSREASDRPATAPDRQANDRPDNDRPVNDRPRTAAPSTAAAAKSANVVLDAFDFRASELIGSTVLDDRGESVGKVDDIVVSTEDDKLHAVIAIGGFAGFGAKLITLPADDLQITADDDNPQVRIAMTGEQLEQLVATRPEFRYERQVAQAPGTEPRG
jgi:sporulation protein YlmC with PRC-barrel domain